MGRYRPPAKKGSPYITAQGYEALSQESRALWERRKDVTKALAAAAAEGDRSENAEYIYRKKELRGIDRRIHYLQKRLPALKVVVEGPGTTDTIFFGAWVALEDSEGVEIVYRIVGPDEFETEPEWISIDSPVAQALLGKHLDDEVTIQTPASVRQLTIVEIRYQQKDRV